MFCMSATKWVYIKMIVVIVQNIRYIVIVIQKNPTVYQRLGPLLKSMKSVCHNTCQQGMHNSATGGKSLLWINKGLYCDTRQRKKWNTLHQVIVQLTLFIRLETCVIYPKEWLVFVWCIHKEGRKHDPLQQWYYRYTVAQHTTIYHTLHN